MLCKIDHVDPDEVESMPKNNSPGKANHWSGAASSRRIRLADPAGICRFMKSTFSERGSE
jgi:hypothetical protein